MSKSQQALSIIQLQSPYLFFVWLLRVSSLARDPIGSTSRAELWPPLCVNSFLLLWFKGLCLEVNPQVIHIFLFRDTVSLCSSGCSGTCFSDKTGLKLEVCLPLPPVLHCSLDHFCPCYSFTVAAAQAELHLEDVCQVTQTHHIPR